MFKIIFEGEVQDEEFETYEQADEYAMYLVSCSELGAEIMGLSNPGDYPYDEETYVDDDYEIYEV